MRGRWTSENLGDVCAIIGGGTPAKSQAAFYSGEVPWATVRDMRQELLTETEFKITKAAVRSSTTAVIPAGNVVIATRVGLGKVCVLGQDTAINQDLRAVVPNDTNRLAVRFLYWWFKSVAHLIEEEGTGATVQGVKLPFVKSLQIPIAPLREQNRVVRILDGAFEAIVAARANAEKNIENARAIFEGQLQAVFSRRGVGWEQALVGSFCEIKHGFAFDGADFSKRVPSGSPIVITPGNFTEDGKLSFNDKNTKRFRGQAPSDFRFAIGDLVVVMTDLSSKMKILGKPAFVDRGDVLHNQRVGRVMFSSSKVEKRFLYYFMMSEGFLKNIRDSATGTMVKHTAPKRILSNEITFPRDRKEQRAIVTRLDSIREEIHRLSSLYNKKLAALDALKSSLLHQAFTGSL